MLRQLHVSLRLQLLGALSFVLLVVVGVAFHASIRDAETSFEERLETDVSVVTSVFRARLLVVEARQRELDFAIERDLAQVRGHARSLTVLNDAIAQLLRHGRETGNTGVVRQAQAAEGHANAYGNAFQRHVAVRERIGLDASSGLRAELQLEDRALASAVEGHADRFGNALASVRAAVDRFKADPTAAAIDEFGQSTAAFESAIESSELDAAERTTIRQAVSAYSAVFRSFADQTSAAAAIAAEVSAAYRKLYVAVETIASTTSSRSGNVALSGGSFYVVLGGCLVALILGILLSLAIARSITEPLRWSASALREAACGNLSVRLEVGTDDELGALATSCNEFLEYLQRVIGAVNQNAKFLAEASVELSATATQLTGNADDMRDRSGTVATAANELSATMNTMERSTDQMSLNVTQVSAAVEEMTVSIAEIASSSQEASAAAEDAARLVEKNDRALVQLTDSAEEIGKVIEVIQDIAGQTNLLALNATIEAARAGTAGQGFAVVAKEVKDLAKQTAEATEDIRLRIEAIQGSAEGSVRAGAETGKAINSVTVVARSIASAVVQQSVTTMQISQNIANTATAAALISSSISQSAAASKEITKIIGGVTQGAVQTAQGANKTHSAGIELADVADELNKLVAQLQS